MSNVAENLSFPKSAFRLIHDAIKEKARAAPVAYQDVRWVNEVLQISPISVRGQISEALFGEISSYRGKTLISDQLWIEEGQAIENGDMASYFTNIDLENYSIIGLERSWLMLEEHFNLEEAYYTAIRYERKKETTKGVFFLFYRNKQERDLFVPYLDFIRNQILNKV